MEITRTQNTNPAFGIAKFSALKNSAREVTIETLEKLCKECPGLDEFTHKHNVSLDTSYWTTKYDDENSIFAYEISTQKTRRKSAYLGVELTIKEKVADLANKVKSFSLKYNVDAHEYEEGFSFIFTESLNNELVSLFKNKKAEDFEKDLQAKITSEVESVAKEKNAKNKLKELKKITKKDSKSDKPKIPTLFSILF